MNFLVGFNGNFKKSKLNDFTRRWRELKLRRTQRLSVKTRPKYDTQKSLLASSLYARSFVQQLKAIDGDGVTLIISSSGEIFQRFSARDRNERNFSFSFSLCI
jgi:hypothetical protein